MPEPGNARIRPALVYAWHGPSLLITGNGGECGKGEALSGFYFREARHLSLLRLTVNGEPPWPCEVATPTPAEIALTLIYPEVTELGGGGSGESQDGVTRDEHGLPHRGLDLRLHYRVGIAALDVELLIANRSGEEVACEVAWELGADFADLQEAHAGKRQQEAPVWAEAAGDRLRLRSGHPALPFETRITASPEGAWTAGEGRLTAALRLGVGQSERLALRIVPHDPEHQLTAEDLERREARWRRWRDGLARVEAPRSQILQRVVERNVADLASFPLLEGADDEWLALQAGMPLYPALFGRDTLTAGWQAAFLDRGESLENSLNRLGRMQTNRFDDWHDEEPGRIPFQVRRGPLARLDFNPFAAYYADFASPFMFVAASPTRSPGAATRSSWSATGTPPAGSSTGRASTATATATATSSTSPARPRAPRTRAGKTAATPSSTRPGGRCRRRSAPASSRATGSPPSR
jgi:glycogen debranching enzyme